jgi:antitoxin component of MazEF toxin-antitoxin module
MARDILKVRKVGGTLVVTLTQSILNRIPLTEGDRVLIEALPSKRILISREEDRVPAARRAELELGVLEARRQALESEIDEAVADYSQRSSDDDRDLAVFVKERTAARDKVAIQIAEKRLELFELQGA